MQAAADQLAITGYQRHGDPLFQGEFVLLWGNSNRIEAIAKEGRWIFSSGIPPRSRNTR